MVKYGTLKIEEKTNPVHYFFKNKNTLYRIYLFQRDYFDFKLIQFFKTIELI